MNARTKEILSSWKQALLPNGNEMKEGTEGSSRREGISRGVEQLSQLGPSSKGRVLVST